MSISSTTTLPSTWDILNNLEHYRQNRPNVVVGRAFGWADRFALLASIPTLFTQGLWLRPLAFATGTVVNYIFEHMGDEPSKEKTSGVRWLASKIQERIDPKLFQTLGICLAAGTGMFAGYQQQDVGQTIDSIPLAIAGSFESSSHLIMMASLTARLTHQKISAAGQAQDKKPLHTGALLTDYVISNTSNAALLLVGGLTILHSALHNNPNALRFWSEMGSGLGLIMTGGLFILGCTTLLKKDMAEVTLRPLGRTR